MGRIKNKSLILILTTALGLAPSFLSAKPKIPELCQNYNLETKVQQVEESIHGLIVNDPYRWLEDGKNEEVQKWVDQQNEYAGCILESIPGREDLRKRLMDLQRSNEKGSIIIRKDRTFRWTRNKGEEKYALYYKNKWEDVWNVVLDENKLKENETIHNSYISPDGKFIAYNLAKNEDEQNVLLHILDINNNKILEEKIAGTSWANVAWLDNNSGFFYTRGPIPGTVPQEEEYYHQKLYFHKLGTEPSLDELVFGKHLKKEEIPQANVTGDGKYLLIHVGRKSWQANDLYYKKLTSNSEIKLIIKDIDAEFNAKIIEGTALVITNYKAPNYRMVRVDLENPKENNWQEIIPEMQYTLSGFEVVGDKILSFYLKDANEKLKLHNLDGGLIKEIKLPTLGSIVSFSKEWDETGFFIRFTSFFVAPTDFRYDLLEDKLEEIQSPQISIATDQFELKQVWYPSKDGTNVPMFIMHQKNIKLNGDNPTILYGYGGFGISLTPSFRDSSIPFLEKGGVYVIANLRGGGEFGEKWHSAGKKEKKQNVFDDFISAAEWLINNRYTNSRRLAIYGSSNGGLLTAATVVQRPDLFKAVIIGAPITDMIRYPIFSMGRYWIQEYGDPDKKEDFEYLIKYSPYHNVRENADYPSILLTTSDTDQRVDPMHARKMAARLQYLNKSNNPIILRTYKSMGHGPGATVSKRIDNLVDHLAFIFSQLGIN